MKEIQKDAGESPVVMKSMRIFAYSRFDLVEGS